MNYPSIKTIESRLNVDRSIAKQIRGLMDGSVDPLSVVITKKWYDECYNKPLQIDLIMNAIDVVSGCYGVEYIEELKVIYCNTGDSYAATVCYSYKTKRFMITSWGDLVERYDRTHKRKDD